MGGGRTWRFDCIRLLLNSCKSLVQITGNMQNMHTKTVQTVHCTYTVNSFSTLFLPVKHHSPDYLNVQTISTNFPFPQ